jgi:hypothetical protein
MKGLMSLVVIGALAAAAKAVEPEVRRYLKIREM